MLGVWFDSISQSWSLPPDKIHKYMYTLQCATLLSRVTKLQLQQVNGIINFLCLLCPSLRFFRAPLVADMKKSYDISPIQLSAGAIQTLHLWLHILSVLKDSSLPIPTLMDSPPTNVTAFCSDAAGCASTSTSAPQLLHSIGAGFAAFLYPASKVFMTGRAFWPENFILTALDEDLKSAGNKTCALELIGWILPLYHALPHIHNSHVVIECDNIGSIFAFHRGRSKTDQWSSTILTAIMEICFEFAIFLHVEHRRRCSTTPSRYADWLSRDDHKGQKIVNMANVPTTEGFPPSLLHWMKDPTFNFFLGQDLVKDCRHRLQ